MAGLYRSDPTLIQREIQTHCNHYLLTITYIKGEKQRTPYTEKTDGAYIQGEEQGTPIKERNDPSYIQGEERVDPYTENTNNTTSIPN